MAAWHAANLPIRTGSQSRHKPSCKHAYACASVGAGLTHVFVFVTDLGCLALLNGLRLANRRVSSCPSLHRRYLGTPTSTNGQCLERQSIAFPSFAGNGTDYCETATGFLAVPLLKHDLVCLDCWFWPTIALNRHRFETLVGAGRPT